MRKIFIIALLLLSSCSKHDIGFVSGTLPPANFPAHQSPDEKPMRRGAILLFIFISIYACH